MNTRSIPEFFEQGRQTMRDLETRADDMIHNRPLTSMTSAFAFGIVVGILLTMSCPAAFPQWKERRLW
jgi:ElaB/YqjD/DUF883 family membrane-anchored ribosome-binding protein